MPAQSRVISPSQLRAQIPGLQLARSQILGAQGARARVDVLVTPLDGLAATKMRREAVALAPAAYRLASITGAAYDSNIPVTPGTGMKNAENYPIAE